MPSNTQPNTDRDTQPNPYRDGYRKHLTTDRSSELRHTGTRHSGARISLLETMTTVAWIGYSREDVMYDTFTSDYSTQLSSGRTPKAPNAPYDPSNLRHAKYRRSTREVTSGGFSLLEMMITIALIGVLVTLASTGLGNWLNRQQLQSNAQAISQNLYLVRRQSIMNGQFTQVNITANTLTVDMIYGQGPVAAIPLQPLMIDDEIQIVDAANTPLMTLLIFTPSGNLLSPINLLRVCSANLTGEMGITYALTPSGRVRPLNNAPACP